MLKLFIFTTVCISIASTYTYTEFLITFQKLFGLIADIDYPENSEELNAAMVAESRLETTQLIELYGYPAENHTAETEDGYIITIHRIPYGKNNQPSSKNSTRRIPVLLMHGMGCSSALWVDNLQDSLGFILADEGFDVWIGNFRPNAYVNHKKYSRIDLKYWDFNSDDYGLHDARAQIDYVLRATSLPRILYLGQSQGNTAIFQLLSTFPEYNDKLAGFVALNAVGGYSYMPIAPAPLARFDALLWTVIPFVLGPQIAQPGLREFGFDVINKACPASNPFFCAFWYGNTCGLDLTLFNKSRVPLFVRHCSYGSSAKTAIQLSEASHYKTFQRFDYGKKENLKVYGSEFPPAYQLDRITSQAAIFSSANDPIANPIDTALLVRHLKNVVHNEVIPVPRLTHSETVVLVNSKEILYGRVIDVMRKMWSSYPDL